MGKFIFTIYLLFFDRNVVLTEEPIEANQVIEEEMKENVYDSQITFQEPIIGYPAPFFAALPFLSMGLPFPPMYMYPQLTPIFYYPYLQLGTTNTNTPNEEEEKKEKEDCLPKPKPACEYCMENEGSLVCLYYQRNADTDIISESFVEAEPLNDTEDSENKVTAKNPGWFGKGYRKGMKRKR